VNRRRSKNTNLKIANAIASPLAAAPRASRKAVMVITEVIATKKNTATVMAIRAKEAAVTAGANVVKEKEVKTNRRRRKRKAEVTMEAATTDRASVNAVAANRPRVNATAKVTVTTKVKTKAEKEKNTDNLLFLPVQTIHTFTFMQTPHAFAEFIV